MADDYGLEYDFPHDADYLAAKAKLAIAGSLTDQMEKLGINRTQLAQRLNVSAGRVTQILAGYSNLTIDTLVAAALGLEATVYFELLPIPAG
ncbi:MAG TPA: helix-turn-helix transcriptional regulator, partial [Tepidiformaceae bacterium]